MKKSSLLLMTILAPGVVAQQPDLSGEWVINSSVGGATPITVYCSLQQTGSELSGTCTPEMENAEASDLEGEVTAGSAAWGYDVFFNGNPGRVDFMASEVSATELSGTLSLSGIEAVFTASREE